MRFNCISVGLVFVAACATMSDVVKAKSEGTQRAYPVTCDQAYDIARKIFRDEGADAIEEHRSEGYMLTSSSANMVTMGTLMGAWVDPGKPGECVVTVVTKRKVQTNVATTLTESTFHDRFAKAVREVATTPRTTASSPSSVDKGRCTKDTDCKGDRICVNGACTEPRGERVGRSQ